MADAVLTRDGPVSVPLDYVVPQGGELAPLTVRAVIDGSGTSSEFYAIVEVISPSGRSMGKYRSDAIAAGASADVTWFPGAELAEAATSGLPVTEVLFLNSTSGTGVTSNTALEVGVNYLVSVQGTYSAWNEVLNMGTPEPNAQFPPSSVAGRASTEVGIDADTLFAWPSDHPHSPGHELNLEWDLGSGFAHIEPFGGPYTTPQPDHFYTYSITGQGSNLTAKIVDALPDNYGRLKITIYGIPGPGSGTVSSVTDGTHTVSPATELDFTSGATVTDGGGGVAQVAVSGGGSISDITSSGGTITVTAPTGPTTNVDLPNSGVTAGTYGDGSHVGQFHVSADGIVTSASSVAIGGSVGGYVAIGNQVLSSDGASMSVGSIPATYTHLECIIATRTDETNAAVRFAMMQFNTDTSTSNYLTQLCVGASAAASGVARSSDGGVAWESDTNSSTSGLFTFVKVTIPLYANASIHKVVTGTGGRYFSEGSTQGASQSIYGIWKSTSAITSILVTPVTAAVNLKAGSSIYVYGIA